MSCFLGLDCPLKLDLENVIGMFSGPYLVKEIKETYFIAFQVEVRFFDHDAGIKRKAAVELNPCEESASTICELLTFLAHEHNAMQASGSHVLTLQVVLGIMDHTFRRTSYLEQLLNACIPLASPIVLTKFTCQIPQLPSRMRVPS